MLDNSLKWAVSLLSAKADERLAFLADHTFGFATYDSEKATLFGQKAVEFIEAVTEGKTFEYQQASEENYTWFLIMANMPFFQKRLEWGTSVRGAWWQPTPGKNGQHVVGGWWYVEDEGLDEFVINREGWIELMRAIVEWTKEERAVLATAQES
jgi:hypothetical protein